MYGYGYSPFTRVVSSSGGIPVDPDAQAFITAAAITDPTQQSAINTLVTDLKGYGIWTKMKAIYPFVGGTASSHRFNLKYPRDLDSAFRLVFNGGWTHSSNGATPNGTNAYADTFLTPSTNLLQNSSHISTYSRTDTSLSGNCLIGVASPSSNNLRLITNFGGAEYIEVNDSSFGRTRTTTTTLGLLNLTRIASNEYKYFQSGIQKGNSIQRTSVTPPNAKIYISALNNSGSALFYSPNQTAFASIGDGLTDTEAANLYTAVQAFQTTLNRQV